MKRETPNTKQNIMEKKQYIKPRIEWIPLDNEISLALESSPPEGPGEIVNNTTMRKSEDPYKGFTV